MKTLATLPGDIRIPHNARVFEREAVRAIIQNGTEILLVHSTRNGDYKFPGGGIEAGENHQQALTRELQEECGATLANEPKSFGVIIEERPHTNPGNLFEFFRMRSYYYQGSLTGSLGPLSLDDYEAQLGFQPVWIELTKAIVANQKVLASGDAPFWTARDTFMLKYLDKLGWVKDSA